MDAILNHLLSTLVITGFIVLAVWELYARKRSGQQCHEYAHRSRCTNCGGRFHPWDGKEYLIGQNSIAAGPVFRCIDCNRESRVSYEYIRTGSQPTCLKCGYMLRHATESKCPECGTTIDTYQQRLLTLIEDRNGAPDSTSE